MNSSRFPSGLHYDELERVAAQFGVDDEQVHRDHLISCLLAGIAAPPLNGAVTFIGGTALTRTWLPEHRLSEDIDLILGHETGRPARDKVAAGLETALERTVARSHGSLRWTPRLSATHGAKSAIITTDSGLSVRVQLLSPTGYPTWPTTVRQIEQRYSGVAPARMTVLTPAGFVAAKTSA